jgi:hypothetical protein
MAFSLVVNLCRFCREILSAHLQVILWNGARLTDATKATLACSGRSTESSLEPESTPPAAKKTVRAILVRALMIFRPPFAVG